MYLYLEYMWLFVCKYIFSSCALMRWQNSRVLRCKSLQVLRHYLLHQWTHFLNLSLRPVLCTVKCLVHLTQLLRNLCLKAKPSKRSPTGGPLPTSMEGVLSLQHCPGGTAPSFIPIDHRVGGFWGDNHKCNTIPANKAPIWESLEDSGITLSLCCLWEWPSFRPPLCGMESPQHFKERDTGVSKQSNTWLSDKVFQRVNS